MTCTHEHEEGPAPAEPGVPTPEQPDDGAGNPVDAWPEVLRVARPLTLTNPVVGR